MLCSMRFTTRRHSRTHVVQTRRPSRYYVRISIRRVHRMCNQTDRWTRARCITPKSPYQHLWVRVRVSSRNYIIRCQYNTGCTQQYTARSSSLYFPTCTFEIIIYSIILYVIFIMLVDERRFVYFFGGIINRV